VGPLIVRVVLAAEMMTSEAIDAIHAGTGSRLPNTERHGLVTIKGTRSHALNISADVDYSAADDTCEVSNYLSHRWREP
jgi:hypothetical protein